MVNAKDKSESWKFTTGAIYWNGNNRTITSDKKIAVGHKTTQTNYFKMKTTESGYITVIASDPKNKIVLYDSKKNRLTESTIANMVSHMVYQREELTILKYGLRQVKMAVIRWWQKIVRFPKKAEAVNPMLWRLRKIPQSKEQWKQE